MGLCAHRCPQRKTVPDRASFPPAENSRGTDSNTSGQRSMYYADEIRETWIEALVHEDAVAAMQCARICETRRGAETFANCDGLEAFTKAAMGEKINGGGGLMQTLLMAMTKEASEHQLAVFEALMAAAKWPTLKGKVAGSGVLGVISAMLLSSKQPPKVKALMARLCATLAVDAPEVVELGDEKRAAEFRKIREQLITSQTVKNIMNLVQPDADGVVITSATKFLEVLILQGEASDRAELVAVVPELLRVLQANLEKSDRKPSCDDEDDDSDAEDNVGEILPGVLRALAAAASVQGDGADALRAPLCEPEAIQSVRQVVAIHSSTRIVEPALQCLRSLCDHGHWHQVDAAFVDDLRRLITYKVATPEACKLLCVILVNPAFGSQLGDLRPLRQTLTAAPEHDPQLAEAIGALEAVAVCHACGVAATKLLRCSRCQHVAYCSVDCQRGDWKAHAAECKRLAAKRCT